MAAWLLFLLAACGACGGGDGGGEARFHLAKEVVAGRFGVTACEATAGEASAGLAFSGSPEVGEVEIDHERRRAVIAAGPGWCWRGRLPRQASLSVGAQRAYGAADEGEPLTIQVEVVAGREREVIAVGRRADGGWIDLTADLSRWAGRTVSLQVTASPSRAGERRPLAWSHAGLTSAASGSSAGGASLGSAPADRRPNVVFILVDTLRADRTTPYGYGRPTTPELERWLAERGVVVEEAYSQAPWTLPSMVSLMSGRYPGELLGESDAASYGLPAQVTTLGERFARLGYQTAAFYANFALRDTNGFGRGFATRYTPPATAVSNQLHADSINARALPWIAAHQHQDQPFFLYVHYLDPHDPYLNEDLVGGRSPFFPDYSGTLTGMDVHAVYVGNRELASEQEDVEQLSALYDSEVRYVDRHLGQLLAALDPEVVANTLFVFTSDHGEELFDHGGWKHGYTLYEEQIHVPLILRWDGRLPAGTRLAGTVELLDLMPTLMAAAAGEASDETRAEADPSWQGIDLLPALAGEKPLPRRPAFAQHLISGPLRAAAVLDRKKVILFNRAEPFAPADLLIERFWRQDLGRLERRELYDLERDPAERGNLVAERPRLAEGLERVVHERLDRILPGLRVLTSGLGAGARLEGRITFAQPPTAWHPYFLAEADRVALAGAVLSFELTGEALEKGVRVVGGGGIVGVEAWLDGLPLSAGRILLGDGRRWQGGEIAEAALSATRRPPAPEGPALRLWRREITTSVTEAALDPEVEESLRALGYIQ